MENRRICGNCIWHSFELHDEDWVCINELSDNFLQWTDYECSCDKFEPRKDVTNAK